MAARRAARLIRSVRPASGRDLQRSQRMSAKKILLILVVLLLAAAGVHFLGHPSGKGTAGAGHAVAAVPVQVAPVAAGDVDLSLQVVGRAEAWSTVTLRAQVSAQLQALGFQPGSRVKKGQLLVQLDPRLLKAQLDQARGAVAKDRAELQKAQADQRRYAAMLARGFVSRADYDAYQANLEVARAALQSDLAAQELAQTQLDYTRVTAPFDGIAGAPLAWPGAQVTAQSTDLVVLNQVEPIRVDFNVPEGSLAAVRAALARGPVPVRAAIPGDPQPLQGTLEFVDNAVDNSTGTILLKARFDNPDMRLTPGQFVQVSLPTARIARALSVPVQAVQSSARGSFVFVLKADGTVAQRYVTPGPSTGGRTVIEQGVSAGEQVVTEGQMLLVDGSRVQVRQGG
ncbi:multidrug efflux system membrane fusion protein [Fulvimonas soli]|jgi:multidrug efflux system membrane fusion protein|uniref:Multidrug efflux system membrane fusion protein n=2 Tax=Fulvimonas soli TaxID=155197 RepID=A0A316HS67_9GAMM|nr:multidrug efflux system membrane fusion protein [Fulvimonas soli]